MARWQGRGGKLFVPENGVVVLLLVLAALLLFPTLDLFAPTSAELARKELAQRIQRVAVRARAEKCIHTIVFSPPTGKIVVTCWRRAIGVARATPEPVRLLTGVLSRDARVARTSLPQHTITVSDQGFLLAQGSIEVVGPDGSQDRLMVENTLGKGTDSAGGR